MENTSKIVKDRRRQYFITEVPKQEAKVHFNQQLDEPLQYQKQFHKISDSVPIQTQIINLEKPEIKSVENKKNKAIGINQLKTLLKSSKQMIDRKRKNVGQNTSAKIEQKQKINKYFRVSISDEQLNCGFDNIASSDKQNPKQSIKIFYQRFHTENLKDSKNTKNGIDCNNQQARRLQRRRKCKITTQSQFEDEYTKYIQKTQKQEVNELFRLVNRQMKLVNRKEPNNYYQKIRKSALKKIDYMSYNQKYYDDEEVRHLYQVVDNCNMLIHRRNSKENDKKVYKSVQTERSRQYSKKKETVLTQRSQNLFDDEQNEKISISSKNFLERSDETIIIRKKSSKMAKISKKQRVQMQQKFNSLVNRCHQQKKMLKQVKTGMKIFEFYCGKLDSGFESRGKRLNNFIKDQQQL